MTSGRWHSKIIPFEQLKLPVRGEGWLDSYFCRIKIIQNEQDKRRLIYVYRG